MRSSTSLTASRYEGGSANLTIVLQNCLPLSYSHWKNRSKSYTKYKLSSYLLWVVSVRSDYLCICLEWVHKRRLPTCRHWWYQTRDAWPPKHSQQAITTHTRNQIQSRFNLECSNIIQSETKYGGQQGWKEKLESVFAGDLEISRYSVVSLMSSLDKNVCQWADYLRLEIRNPLDMLSWLGKSSYYSYNYSWIARDALLLNLSLKSWQALKDAFSIHFTPIEYLFNFVQRTALKVSLRLEQEFTYTSRGFFGLLYIKWAVVITEVVHGFGGHYW